MPFAKIVDGKLEYAPYEIYTEDGRVIELNTREKCLENGYSEVITIITSAPPENIRVGIPEL